MQYVNHMYVHTHREILNSLFTSRSSRTAGSKIVLRFPCLFVCLAVCAFTLITCHVRNIYYVIRYYATANNYHHLFSENSAIKDNETTDF